MRKKIILSIIILIAFAITYLVFLTEINNYFFSRHVIYWSENVKVNFSDYQEEPDYDSKLKIVHYHGLHLYAKNIETAVVLAFFDKNESWVKDSTDFNVEAIKSFQKIRFDVNEVYARKFNFEIDKIRHNPNTTLDDLKSIGDKLYKEKEVLEDSIYAGDYSTEESVKIWKPKVEKLLEESKNYR